MNKLKYGIILTAMLFAQSVFADTSQTTRNTMEVEGFVVHSVEHAQTNKKVITPIKSCKVVEVPIYGKTGGAQTGEVLGGAIIGGILGNQVGGGSGKDAATILGAILGADIANKKSGKKVIVGYKQVEQCEIVNQVEYVPNPTTCTTTVAIPSIHNIKHRFTSTACPSVNSRYMVYVDISSRLANGQ